jgi:hypothetical protein
MDMRSLAMMFAGLMMGVAAIAPDGGVHAEHSSAVRVPGGSALGS